MTETKRLGRGLEALLGPMSREQAEATGALREVAVSAISPNPFQPRRSFDDAALSELAASISASGLLQPITVRAVGARDELIGRRAPVAGGPAPRLVAGLGDRP